MAGLLDLITQGRAKRAQELADRTALVDDGALSTAPAPAPTYDPSQPMGRFGAPSPADQDIQNATTGFMPRVVGAGVLDLTGSLKGAMAATAQALGQDNFSERLLDASRKDAAAAAAQTPDQVTDMRDIDGPGSAVNFFGSAALRGLPMIAGMGAAGLAGGVGGAAAAAVGMNAGQIYTGIRDNIDARQKAGEISPEDAARHRQNALGATGIGGVVSGALDLTGFGAIFKANPIARALVMKSLKGHVAESMLIEGGTEGLQQYVQQVATKTATERPDVFGVTPEEGWEIANAAASGAAMAAPLAPVGHFGRSIADGADRAATMAGDAARFFRNPDAGAPQAAPGVPPPPAGPSGAERLGASFGALLDGNTDQLREAGGAMVAKLNELPGVGAAIQGGQDFMTGLRSSQRVGAAEDALGQFKQNITAGFQAFRNAVGDTAQTDNLVAARNRYQEYLAHAFGAQGLDADAIGKLSAQKVDALISGVNAALPKVENAAKSIMAGGKAFVHNVDLSPISDNMPGPMTPEGAAKVGGLAGEAVSRGAGHVGAAMAGVNKVARTYFHPPEQVNSDLRSMADSMRPLQGDEQMTLKGATSPEAQKLKEAMLDLAADNPGDRTQFENNALLLARRIERLSKMKDTTRFDRFLQDQAKTIRSVFDMSPQDFRDKVLAPTGVHLRQEAAAGRKTKMESLAETQNEATGSNIDDNDLNSGEALQDVDFSDVLTEVDHANQTGEHDPHMDAEKFTRMLASKKDVDSRYKGLRYVILRSTYTDPITGQVDESKTIEKPYPVKFSNVAQTWAGAARAQEKFQRGERSAKLTNFKEGVGALLSGWSETDGKQNVKREVIPATRTSKDGAPLTAAPLEDAAADWFKPGVVVGTQGTDKKGNPKFLRYADVENDARANQPVDVEGALETYYKSLAETEDWKPAARESRKAKAADSLANFVVESIRSRWTKYDEPGRENPVPSMEQREVYLDAAMEYAVSGGESSSQNVPTEIRSLPHDVLLAAKTSILSRLSSLYEELQKQKQYLDEPGYRDAMEQTGENEEGVQTEDYSQQHINYKKTIEAGENIPDAPAPTEGRLKRALPTGFGTTNEAPTMARVRKNQEAEGRQGELPVDQTQPVVQQTPGQGGKGETAEQLLAAAGVDTTVQPNKPYSPAKVGRSQAEELHTGTEVDLTQPDQRELPLRDRNIPKNTGPQSTVGARPEAIAALRAAFRKAGDNAATRAIVGRVLRNVVADRRLSDATLRGVARAAAAGRISSLESYLQRPSAANVAKMNRVQLVNRAVVAYQTADPEKSLKAIDGLVNSRTDAQLRKDILWLAKNQAAPAGMREGPPIDDYNYIPPDQLNLDEGAPREGPPEPDNEAINAPGMRDEIPPQGQAAKELRAQETEAMAGAALGGTRKDGTPYINAKAAAADFAAGFPYIFGGEKSGVASSRQKALVFKQLGISKEAFAEAVPDVETYKKFLMAHEMSHVKHKDVENYPKRVDGRYDLMNKKAIDIEKRAVQEALAEIKREEGPGRPKA
jgi:hypothetical protein